MGEEDDLCASSGEGCCHDGADAGCSSLGLLQLVFISATGNYSRGGEGVEGRGRGGPTVIMMILECSNRSERLTAPPK